MGLGSNSLPIVVDRASEYRCTWTLIDYWPIVSALPIVSPFALGAKLRPTSFFGAFSYMLDSPVPCEFIVSSDSPFVVFASIRISVDVFSGFVSGFGPGRRLHLIEVFPSTPVIAFIFMYFTEVLSILKVTVLPRSSKRNTAVSLGLVQVLYALQRRCSFAQLGRQNNT